MEVEKTARHAMTVCNACRYCEAYCPVFPAMEERLTFSPGDLAYLANLCHNCGECLYACQYAPPHEFAINVPRTFAELRVKSYEQAAWPAFAAVAFRRPRAATLLAVLVSAAAISAAVGRTFMVRASAADNPADFYAVIPHDGMVTVFGIAALFAVTALSIGCRRFARTIASGANGSSRAATRLAARDALTLQHLHGAGDDCTDAEETRRPWRRWMHHCTFYGFLLCAASTSVAAIYDFLGWVAPYDYTSAPVVLGTLGGLGLLIGPSGLFLVDRTRDADLTHESQATLDGAFLAMLFLTSLTGLLLLAFREAAWMRMLLIVHLAFVLALFVTLPYGKFVHGLYRAAALVKFRDEVTK